MCHAWLLLLLWLSAQPLVLLLGLWAIVVLLLVAALVGHRDDIHRGKHAVESAVGGDAAAAYPAIASAGGIAAVAAVPTHAALPVHVPRVPSATGITSQPRLSQLRGHLPLLAQALRLVLTRSLGMAAAVALLFIVSYVLCIALNTWLAEYVFVTLGVPGLLTGAAAMQLTVVQLMAVQLLTW
ncbi:unnamed protein product [Closterium sp. NIES-54]